MKESIFGTMTMKNVVKHMLFWIIIFVVYSYMISFFYEGFTFLYTNIVNVLLFMLAYYMLRYVQIPYIYNRGKKGWFVLSIFAMSVLLFWLYYMNWNLWLQVAVRKYNNEVDVSLGPYLVRTIRFYSPAMILLAWESFHNQRLEKERIAQLETEKLATELKFLKAQINPHFLFNTLNNLYSYVVTQSPKAPDMILHLSGILEYVLSKSQNQTVPLQEEVNAIAYFLKLEQIRYGDRLEVNFKTEGDLNIPVSPLILLSIVENAFKHGASSDIDFPKIEIEIAAKETSIFCKVWNTKSQYQGEINDAYKEGIGLTNIKRQLNLIYPNRHNLNIDDQKDTFSFSLLINPLV